MEFATAVVHRTMALWSVVVVVVCVFVASLPATVGNERKGNNGMSTRLFEGLPNVVEVECSGVTLGSAVELFSMTLYAIEDDIVLASVSLAKNECGTSSSFSACFIDSRDPFNTRLKTLVVDLEHEEQRLYGCNISLTEAGRPAIMHWSIAATLHRQQTTSTTAFPGYTAFTVADLPIASEVLEPDTDLQVPTSAVIVGLMLLIFFIILTIALIALRFRGNSSSNQSWHYDEPRTPIRDDLYAKPIFPADKDRKPGGLLSRDTPTQSPAHLAPNTPPRNPALLVRYQTPLGTSAYYAEPWGRPDEEGQDRMRPGIRAVGHVAPDIRVARAGHVATCDEKGCPLVAVSQDDNT